jgi:transcriptional regulator with XRE-family HTH domain
MLLTSVLIAPMQLKFGEWFSLRRRQRRLSQGDVAKVLQIKPQTISNWENGKTIPNLDPDQFFRLCGLFEVTVEDLARAFRGELEIND